MYSFAVTKSSYYKKFPRCLHCFSRGSRLLQHRGPEKSRLLYGIQLRPWHEPDQTQGQSILRHAACSPARAHPLPGHFLTRERITRLDFTMLCHKINRMVCFHPFTSQKSPINIPFRPVLNLSFSVPMRLSAKVPG